MRFLVLLLAAGLAVTPAVASAQRGLQRNEQTGAYRAMQQGQVLSLPEIRARINVPNAQFIGVEIIGGMIYRLKYMRGSDVIWIDVDARTGRIVAQTGR
jgi:ferredoxin-NADP reductase